MITASFYLDDQAVVRAFTFEGHSGYAEAGHDIVCAGMSTLAVSVIGSLQELIKTEPDYSIDEETGRISCELKDYEHYDQEDKLKAKTLMEAVLIGTKQALDAYGKYIKLRELEYSGR